MISHPRKKAPLVTSPISSSGFCGFLTSPYPTPSPHTQKKGPKKGDKLLYSWSLISSSPLPSPLLFYLFNKKSRSASINKGNLLISVAIIYSFGFGVFHSISYCQKVAHTWVNIMLVHKYPLPFYTLSLFYNQTALQRPSSFCLLFLSSSFSCFTSIKYPTHLLFLLLNHFLFSSSKYKPSKRKRERHFFLSIYNGKK